MPKTRQSSAAQFFDEDQQPSEESPPATRMSTRSTRSTTRASPRKRIKKEVIAEEIMEEEVQQQETPAAAAASTVSSSDQVVELLNDASMATDPTERIDALRKVQELIIHKDPELLDNFLDEVIGFQTDRTQDVRKWVVAFMEEACKTDPELLTRVITNLRILVNDDAVAVRKRVIQAMTFLYKSALSWLCSAKIINDKMEAVWSSVSEIKAEICGLIDSDNDGVRTHAIKFMEMLVIAQTYIENNKNKDFSLDDVPMNLKLIRRRKLEEEADAVFENLLKYHGSVHISSANLMTCMSSLANIAKLRSKPFLSKVITALEMLHANLPPTLAKSQVSSVRKHLKNQLLALLRSLPVVAEKYFMNVTTLLTDLGAGNDEVKKAVPNFDDLMRRSKAELASKKAASAELEKSADEPRAKKAKIDIPVDDDDSEDSDDEGNLAGKGQQGGGIGPGSGSGKSSTETSAIDVTEAFVRDRMDPAIVTEMVMRSLPRLPPTIPPQFYQSYTPIAAAGTEGQVKHVSRLLAAQLTRHGLGPGAKQQAENKMRKQQQQSASSYRQKHLEAIDEIMDDLPKKRPILLPAGMTKKKTVVTKSLKLSEVTKGLMGDERNSLMVKAVQRVLKADRVATFGGLKSTRTKMVVTLASRYSGNNGNKACILAFLFEDLSKRIDLAMSLLFEEYCVYQGFHRSIDRRRPADDTDYNSIYCHLIKGVMDRTEGKDREILLRRLYLESPIITEEAINLLRSFVSQGPALLLVVVNLMKDLVTRRPTKKLNFLNFLLEFCTHALAEVRQTATATVLQLYIDGEVREIIEDYATMYLKFLKSSVPPSMLFTHDRGRDGVALHYWPDDVAKVCMGLFLSLLPTNQNLLRTLTDVYTSSKTNVTDLGTGKQVSLKSVILREIDAPISKVPMDSPALMELLDDFDPASETLINRMIHILTDKTPPTPELVDRVRGLYKARKTDVRFIIPVLNGLSKSEVIRVLPKLILLSPNVVKEVFHRLMGAGSPLTPADLLIALHNMGTTKEVMDATKLCFMEKSVYTLEVLAMVLQELMEQPTLPTLFMRTVIQSLTLYPKMLGFVLNILQRLVTKKVWETKVLWDGFIKCCEKTAPQSYAVILDLPPEELTKFLTDAKQLREPLREHVDNFTAKDRVKYKAEAIRVVYSMDDEANVKDGKADGDEPPGEDSIGDTMKPLT